MKQKLLVLTLVLSAFVALFPSASVRADVAPPEAPPGANINPGGEVTQVRMIAETVILNIVADPADSDGAIANTVATFTMRNLGNTEEKMQARFPLSFFNGNSDGFFNFPEIPSIRVKVNGIRVDTRREMQPALITEGWSYSEREEVPWAVFDVTFPPGEDVTIEVSYTVSGYGYYPYEAFNYVLETGAGWNDTIGVADIIVRFPYAVDGKNIWLLEETTGYSHTSPGAVLSGDEVRWHFENLEPTWEDNIEITVVAPALWQKVLKETEAVTRNPNDGEAWGRLGKAYKEIVRMSKGYLRTDPASQEMYALSKQAYEKSLALLPNDPLWHYGYADLLWPHYYFDLYLMGLPDTEGFLPLILTELRSSLELDPNNQLAKDLLTWISYSVPGAVTITDSGYDFLALTATPIPPAPFVFATETPISSPTKIGHSATPAPVIPSPAPTEKPGSLPFCGGAVLVLPALFGGLLLSKRRLH